MTYRQQRNPIVECVTYFPCNFFFFEWKTFLLIWTTLNLLIQTQHMAKTNIH